MKNRPIFKIGRTGCHLGQTDIGQDKAAGCIPHDVAGLDVFCSARSISNTRQNKSRPRLAAERLSNL
jgi:hypothetical protein